VLLLQLWLLWVVDFEKASSINCKTTYFVFIAIRGKLNGNFCYKIKLTCKFVALPFALWQTVNRIDDECLKLFYFIVLFYYVLTDDMAKTVAAFLVQSRLDYANSILRGSTNSRRLQTVQNSVARIVLLPSSRHLSSINLLRELHWLPIHSCIAFNLASITYKTLSTDQPIHLRSLLDQ